MLSQSTVYHTSSLNEGQQAIRRFDHRALLSLATTDLTIPFHARAKLLRDFKSALTNVGLPTRFYDILQHHPSVLSGSFVPFFLDGTVHATPFPAINEHIHDVDLYVALGHVDFVIEDIRNMSDCKIVSFYSTRLPKPNENAGTYAEDGAFLANIQDGPFYDNYTISSMVRMTLERDDGCKCMLDVIESASTSPLMPILLFSLSHLRLALSADGLFEFHPDWHPPSSNVTYVSPRAYERQGDEDVVTYPTEHFLQKYEKRGFKIIHSWQGDETPRNENHECYVSLSCPLTLRNTTDAGVRFVPFTEDAAIRMLQEPHPFQFHPTLEWRHGGTCTKSEGAKEIAIVQEQATE